MLLKWQFILESIRVYCYEFLQVPWGGFKKAFMTTPVQRSGVNAELRLFLIITHLIPKCKSTGQKQDITLKSSIFKIVQNSVFQSTGLQS